MDTSWEVLKHCHRTVCRPNTGTQTQTQHKHWCWGKTRMQQRADSNSPRSALRSRCRERLPIPMLQQQQCDSVGETLSLSLSLSLSIFLSCDQSVKNELAEEQRCCSPLLLKCSRQPSANAGHAVVALASGKCMFTAKQSPMKKGLATMDSFSE